MAELLCPAGNFEKMKAAILYGANAVYLAGNHFGMRAAADNFTDEELTEAVAYAHARGVKIYVTVNTMPHPAEYDALRKYVKFLGESGVDAVIVSDLGVFATVRELAPELEIHVSTQASTVSAEAANMWYKLGAKRVVLARELTLNEIRAIRKNIPADLELEAFVHGSMCISYSGRCLLSNFYTGRDANRGMCAQPCRWNFNTCPTLTVAEEKRPESPLPMEEYPEGTFVMSSKDTCMIEHIPELMTSGIDSFKVEGRMKSAYYTAVVANAYRMAIDAYNKGDYVYDPAWLRELESVSHREYATGFYFHTPSEDANVVTEPGYLREKAYLCVALTASDEGGYATFGQRNKIVLGSTVEMITPGACGRPFEVTELYDTEGNPIESAPHPYMEFRMKVPFPVRPGDIVRA